MQYQVTPKVWMVKFGTCVNQFFLMIFLTKCPGVMVCTVPIYCLGKLGKRNWLQGTFPHCFFFKKTSTSITSGTALLMFQNHTRLTVYYIKPFLYDIIVSLRLSHCYFTKCIGYNMNCIGAIMKSNQVGTITIRIATNTLCKVILTKS